MFTPITMHPPLFGRFDRDSGFGGGARGGFSHGPARRPEPKGETDSAGNYRNDNVWRSSNSSAPRGGAPREGGFGGDRGGGFRKPWEKREGGFGGGGAPREGGFGGDRGGGFRKPWEKREGGFGGGGAPREGGFHKPWEKREGGFGGGGAPREGGDRGDRGGGFHKPWEKREGGFGGGGAPREGGFGGDRGGGFHKPWEKREGGFGGGGGAPREGGFGGDRGGGFHKPWEKREGGFGGGGGAPREGGFGGDRGGGFHKPWEKREGGFGGGGGAPREGGFGGDRGGGFRKPWEKREGGFGGGERREGGFSKPWENRDRPENTDRAPAPAKAPHVPKVPEGELLFGRQPVREMLRANRRIVKEMMISDGVKDSEEVLEIKKTCEERGIKIEFHKKETFDSWLNSANHQGIVAACEEYPYAELDEVLAALEAKQGNALIVVLDHVVDPQNLGSLLRTCETAGAVGVVLPSDRAVGVTPAAVRASAGAAEHLLIARIPNLVSVLERMKELNVWSTGLEALPESKPYTAIDFKGKVCIVIGSEGHGLCSPVRGKCDNLVSLPMFGKVSSLNAGVAGAIAIYEVLRQQNA